MEKKSVYLLTEKELHLDFNSLDVRKSPEEPAWKDFTSSAERCLNVYTALKMTSKCSKNKSKLGRGAESVKITLGPNKSCIIHFWY